MRETFRQRMGYQGTKRQMTRRFMKYVRQMNKQIAEDIAFKGRFECGPVDIQFDHFSDGSGTDMFVTMAFYDKKTGQIGLTRASATWFIDFNRLWILMNQFIVEVCKAPAWSDGDSIKDYTKVRPDWNKVRKDGWYAPGTWFWE